MAQAAPLYREPADVAPGDTFPLPGGANAQQGPFSDQGFIDGKEFPLPIGCDISDFDGLHDFWSKFGEKSVISDGIRRLAPCTHVTAGESSADPGTMATTGIAPINEPSHLSEDTFVERVFLRGGLSAELLKILNKDDRIPVVGGAPIGYSAHVAIMNNEHDAIKAIYGDDGIWSPFINQNYAVRAVFRPSLSRPCVFGGGEDAGDGGEADAEGEDAGGDDDAIILVGEGATASIRQAVQNCSAPEGLDQLENPEFWTRSYIQGTLVDQGITGDVFFICDVAKGNIRQDLSQASRAGGQTMYWFQTPQTQFDPAGKTGWAGKGKQIGFQDPDTGFKFAWQNNAPGIARNYLYPAWPTDGTRFLANLSRDAAGADEQQLAVRKDCLMTYSTPEGASNFPKQQEAYLFMKQVDNDGRETGKFVYANKKAAAKSTVTTALSHSDKLQYVESGSKFLATLSKLFGIAEGANAADVYGEYSSPYLFLAKRFGDGAQAAACSQGPIPYCIPSDQAYTDAPGEINQAEYVKDKDESGNVLMTNGNHAYVSYDRLAVAAACLYLAPIVVYSQEAGFVIFTRKDLLDPLKRCSAEIAQSGPTGTWQMISAAQLPPLPAQLAQVQADRDRVADARTRMRSLLSNIDPSAPLVNRDGQYVFVRSWSSSVITASKKNALNDLYLSSNDSLRCLCGAALALAPLLQLASTASTKSSDQGLAAFVSSKNALVTECCRQVDAAIGAFGGPAFTAGEYIDAGPFTLDMNLVANFCQRGAQSQSLDAVMTTFATRVNELLTAANMAPAVDDGAKAQYEALGTSLSALNSAVSSCSIELLAVMKEQANFTGAGAWVDMQQQITPEMLAPAGANAVGDDLITFVYTHMPTKYRSNLEGIRPYILASKSRPKLVRGSRGILKGLISMATPGVSAAAKLQATLEANRTAAFTDINSDCGLDTAVFVASDALLATGDTEAFSSFREKVISAFSFMATTIAPIAQAISNNVALALSKLDTRLTLLNAIDMIGNRTISSVINSGGFQVPNVGGVGKAKIVYENSTRQQPRQLWPTAVQVLAGRDPLSIIADAEALSQAERAQSTFVTAMQTGGMTNDESSSEEDDPELSSIYDSSDGRSSLGSSVDDERMREADVAAAADSRPPSRGKRDRDGSGDERPTSKPMSSDFQDAREAARESLRERNTPLMTTPVSNIFNVIRAVGALSSVVVGNDVMEYVLTPAEYGSYTGALTVPIQPVSQQTSAKIRSVVQSAQLLHDVARLLYSSTQLGEYVNRRTIMMSIDTPDGRTVRLTTTNLRFALELLTCMHVPELDTTPTVAGTEYAWPDSLSRQLPSYVHVGDVTAIGFTPNAATVVSVPDVYERVQKDDVEGQRQPGYSRERYRISTMSDAEGKVVLPVYYVYTPTSAAVSDTNSVLASSSFSYVPPPGGEQLSVGVDGIATSLHTAFGDDMRLGATEAVQQDGVRRDFPVLGDAVNVNGFIMSEANLPLFAALHGTYSDVTNQDGTTNVLLANPAASQIDSVEFSKAFNGALNVRQSILRGDPDAVGMDIRALVRQHFNIRATRRSARVAAAMMGTLAGGAGTRSSEPVEEDEDLEIVPKGEMAECFLALLDATGTIEGGQYEVDQAKCIALRDAIVEVRTTPYEVLLEAAGLLPSEEAETEAAKSGTSVDASIEQGEMKAKQGVEDIEEAGKDITAAAAQVATSDAEDVGAKIEAEIQPRETPAKPTRTTFAPITPVVATAPKTPVVATAPKTPFAPIKMQTGRTFVDLMPGRDLFGSPLMGPAAAGGRARTRRAKNRKRGTKKKEL